jgi:hypothetical protein
MTLVTPSMVLGDYSVYPSKMVIDGSEILYYFVSGMCTFFFHSQVSHLMSLPNRSKSYLALYAIVLAALMAIAIDATSFGHPLTGL